MSEKHVVVQGAELICKFSVEPNKTDELEVNTHTKHYANDKDSSKKAIATHKDIGKTCKMGTFGKCKLQPNGSGDYLPCQCIIQEWLEYYEKLKFEVNGGHPLTEDSKGTCPIGGPGCITIHKHGQKAEATQSDKERANDTVMAHLFPFGNLKKKNIIYQLPKE